MSDILTGPSAEEWFRKFAIETSIISRLDCSVELLVRIFDRELSDRLEDALTFIEDRIPQGHSWIREILDGRSPSIYTSSEKQFLSDYLLDKVLATDVLVNVKDNQGINKKIAVDVTINTPKELGKLGKIQGKPGKRDTDILNRNANLPAVRKILGIDKQIVLTLSSYRPNLPSYDYLLNQLQGVANARQKTLALNLVEVPEHEKLNRSQLLNLDSRQMWDKFIQGVPPQAKHLMSAIAAARAIQAGYDRSDVCSMLTHDPQYRQFMRRDESKAEEYAQRIYDLALEKIERQNPGSLTSQSKQQKIVDDSPAQSTVEPDSQLPRSEPQRRPPPRSSPSPDIDLER